MPRRTIYICITPVCSTLLQVAAVLQKNKTIFNPKAATVESNTMSKFVGGAKIQKELQGFAAFVAYQECHYKGLSSSKESMEHSMEQQFFGVKDDDDSIGLSEQLVKGIGVFGGLYTLEEGIAMVDGASAFAKNTEHARHDSVLVLKPELHCLGRHIHIACELENGILLPLMLQVGLTNTDDHATIRTLKISSNGVSEKLQEGLVHCHVS